MAFAAGVTEVPAQGTVTIDDTGGVIRPVNGKRTNLLLQNRGPNDMELRVAETAVLDESYLLEVGATFKLSDLLVNADDDFAMAAVYGICAGGETAKIFYLESERP